jgi:hypothetical protein
LDVNIIEKKNLSISKKFVNKIANLIYPPF